MSKHKSSFLDIWTPNPSMHFISRFQWSFQSLFQTYKTELGPINVWCMSLKIIYNLGVLGGVVSFSFFVFVFSSSKYAREFNFATSRYNIFCFY